MGDQGYNLNGQELNNDEKKLQVAAAVGVTWSMHDATVKVGRLVAGKSIAVTSVNAGNFNTRSTGAAFSTGFNSNSANTISAAVGFSVNDNTATIEATGDLIAGKKDKAVGDVTVDATLTQNLSGKYAGLQAVQSVSGAISGMNTEKSIAGALSTVYSHAKTSAILTGVNRIEGNAV